MRALLLHFLKLNLPFRENFKILVNVLKFSSFFGILLLILPVVSLELDEHGQDIASVRELLSAKGQLVQLLKDTQQMLIRLRHVEG